MAGAIVPNMNEIVRPFVSAPISESSASSRTDSTTTTVPQLAISASIGTSVDAAALPSLGVQTKWNEDKSQRQTEKAKVYNPDDDSQYVEVERMTSAVFTDNQTGKTYTLQFAKWDDGRT